MGYSGQPRNSFAKLRNKSVMFRTVFRNLAHTLRRYPVPAAINLAGLVVALAAFAVIASHVKFELEYDRSYPTSGRIFRVDCPGNEETFRSILPNAFGKDVINSSAHIEAGAMLMPYMGKQAFRADDRNGQPHGYELQCDMVQPDFLEVFGMRILDGDRDALEKPGTVIIPRSMADNIFSGEAVGKTLYTDKSWFFREGQVTVGAVYEDFPANSNLRNSIYLSADERLVPYTYGAANFICYLLLDDPASAPAVEEAFNSSFDFSMSWMSPIELVPMEDIYFLGQGGDGRIFRSGSRGTTFLLISIGILVLLSGVINFANFFTSLAPVRLRSINVQKVLGASTARLRVILTLETVVISLICLVIAFFLAAWLSRILVAGNVLSGAFSMRDAGLMALVGLVTVAAGVLAGLYPGWYATSFPPALVLKGDFGLSRGGRTFRSVMSGIQYVAAFVTLIFMTFVLLQNSRMKSGDMGFDKDRIAVAEVSSSIEEKMQMLRAGASGYPSISGIAVSSEKVGSQDDYSTEGIEIDGKTVSSFILGIDWNFMDVMGIDIVEGRSFNQYDSAGVAMVSRHFLDRYGVHPGDVLPGVGKVVGVCDNIRFNSVREPDSPVAFVPSNVYMSGGVMYFRINSGSDAVTAASEIRSLLQEADPYWSGEVEFYDTILDNLYQNEVRTSRLVVAFSIIAAILALCGVIGLVIFDTEYRRKETSVRRIFGAGVASILERASLSYGTVVLVCFAVACPASIFMVSRWLQNFVDREPMHVWVFVLVLAAVLAVTVLAVISVFWRSATANPRDGLQ